VEICFLSWFKDVNRSLESWPKCVLNCKWLLMNGHLRKDASEKVRVVESLKDGHMVTWEEAAGLRMLRRLRVELFFSPAASSTVRWLFKEAKEGLW
jgi:hypothetical protein